MDPLQFLSDLVDVCRTVEAMKRGENPARDPCFERWLQTQGIACDASDEQILHDIFDAMDDEDKMLN